LFRVSIIFEGLANLIAAVAARHTLIIRRLWGGKKVKKSNGFVFSFLIFSSRENN